MKNEMKNENQEFVEVPVEERGFTSTIRYRAMLRVSEISEIVNDCAMEGKCTVVMKNGRTYTVSIGYEDMLEKALRLRMTDYEKIR